MKLQRTLTVLTLVSLAGWILVQLTLALTLRVEGFDGYWYLSNAWYLAGGPVSQYEITKAPLLSLLCWPFYLLRRLGAPEIVPFTASHLLAVALTLATGLLLIRLLSRSVSRSLAWAGGFAFLGSRIVFRYAAFAMSDLPATLAVLICLGAVHRDHQRDGLSARLPLAAGVAASILARYSAGLILPVTVAWDLAALWADSHSSRRLFRRFLHHLQAAALAGLLVGLIHLAVYAIPYGNLAGMATAFQDMLARNARLGGISIRGLEPWWEYGPMLVLASTLPMVLLMGLGFFQILHRGNKMARLHGLWALISLLFISLVSSHKEARYLLPVLPSLFLFGLWGLSTLARLAHRCSPFPIQEKWSQAAAILFLLVVGWTGLLQEARQLSQPFFRQARAAHIAAWANQQVPPPGRLAWVGNFYPLFPPRHLFHPGDEYYYIFHLGPHIIEYYTGRKMLSFRHKPAQQLAGILYPLGGGTVLRNGDGLISSIPAVSVTNHLPQELPPLVLSPTRVWELEQQDETQPNLFRTSGENLSARVRGHGTLEIHAFPGPTEVLVHLPGRRMVSLGLFPASQGTIRLELAPDMAANMDSIRLLRYAPQAVPIQLQH